jgi:tetratricopeptide (TPR) repeat protein
MSTLFLAQGRYREATEILERGRVMHDPLLGLYLRTERPDKALVLLEGMWDSAVERDDIWEKTGVLFAQGYALVQKGDLEAASEKADDLKSLIDSGMNRKRIRFHSHLMGLIELERGRPAQAVDRLQEAVDLLYHPNSNFPHIHAVFFWNLAQAEFEAEEWESARASYERILGLNAARLRDGDLYAKSFYMLGKIYERQGDTVKAREHFERFLSLWQNADPDLPEVADARARLSELKNP